MTDKFPEAFERFTDNVSIRNIKTWKQLELAFGHWAGRKWVPTSKQLHGLAIQARKLGIEPARYPTRDEQIRAIFHTRLPIEQQKEVKREKGFSKSYSSFNVWMEMTTRTTAYQRRVINYIRTHPNATLTEARGHKAKRF